MAKDGLRILTPAQFIIKYNYYEQDIISAMGNASTTAAASALLVTEQMGTVLTVGLNRPAKRNALNDGIILAIQDCFSSIPDDIRAVVVHGIGEHFSAGLDLSELTERDATAGLIHSQMWHRVFDRIQYSRVPVIAALRGAVIGGGLELACAAHIRVAEPSAYYALPEGQRGIFVGGGGSVRLPRLIGVARMADMMLTGRVYSATEGVPLGFSQYLTAEGGAFDKAMELAAQVAKNAPLTNFAVLQALPMIAEANPQTGLLMESLMATVAQSDQEAKIRIRAFLDRKTAKVRPT
jgi:enoyl-CoA hydratase/carnithine racemase